MGATGASQEEAMIHEVYEVSFSFKILTL